MAFRPLRRKSGEDDDSGSERGRLNNRGSDGDAADSGVPVGGNEENHYQYNVDSYDSYEGSDVRGPTTRDEDGSYERGVPGTEDGGSQAVKRHQARTQQKRRCLIVSGLMGTLVVLGGAAVGGYFIWDTQFRDKGDAGPASETDDGSRLEPASNLADLCSAESLLTTDGYNTCFLACEEGKCCFVNSSSYNGTSDSSCLENKTDFCLLYAPCEPMFAMDEPNATDSNATSSELKYCATVIPSAKNGRGKDIRERQLENGGDLNSTHTNLDILGSMTCFPGKMTCVSDNDCLPAVGNDGVQYGSCVEDCSLDDSVVGDVKYCTGIFVMTEVDGAQQNMERERERERKREICHPDKKECTSDSDCMELSFELDTPPEAKVCIPGCEVSVFEIDTSTVASATSFIEEATFSSSMTIENRLECLLNKDEEAAFCQGVSFGASTLVPPSDTATVVPFCEVIAQECATSASGRRLRLLQSSETINLSYNLTWEIESEEGMKLVMDLIGEDGTLVDNFLSLSSEPTSLFQEELKDFLQQEANLFVSALTPPELVNVKSNETELISNTTNTTDVEPMGVCGKVGDSGASWDCSEIPCLENEDCLKVNGGADMTCTNECLPNSTEIIGNSNMNITDVVNVTMGFCGYLDYAPPSNNTNGTDLDAGNTTCIVDMPCESDSDCFLPDEGFIEAMPAIELKCIFTCLNNTDDFFNETEQSMIDTEFGLNETLFIDNVFNSTGNNETENNSTYSLVNGYCGIRNTTKSGGIAINETDMDSAPFCDDSQTECEMDDDCSGLEGNSTCLDTCYIKVMNSSSLEIVPEVIGITEGEVVSSGLEMSVLSAPSSGLEASTMKRCATMMEPDPNDSSLIATESGVSLKCSTIYTEECKEDADCFFALGDENGVCVIECSPIIKRCATMTEPNPDDSTLIPTQSGVSLSCSTIHTEECSEDADCFFALGDTNAVCVGECAP